MSIAEPAVGNAARPGRRVHVTGRVQGVGYRPFVYRMADRYGLAGTVRNDAGCVRIDAYGTVAALASFVEALVQEAPPLARPTITAVEMLPPAVATGFRIVASTGLGTADAQLPPDQSLCADCERELFDPGNRRWRYPFINCTQCGPRYTLIRGLPYDRPATSMRSFELCAACRCEYEDPTDRRFHAEALACPQCGPRLHFEGAGAGAAFGDRALAACIDALRAGAIVAAKGVGGYHLLCDARSRQAVERLRARKRRPDKPFAVMFPLRGPDGLDDVRSETAPDADDCAALRDAARPIVLLRRCAGGTLPAILAPGLDELGVLLPYSPLHALLLHDFGGPLVATSGNLSGEPVLTDNVEAARRLAPVADCFLHHDRPIVRPADDAVVRVVQGRARPVRPGRGTAPLQLRLGMRLDEPVLAAGGQMKNTLAIGFDDRIIVSPHIGDLESPRSRDVHASVARDLQQLYRVAAARIIVDPHPGYASTAWARSTGLPLTPVLHHFAHASALAWERPDIASWLVLAWDGVGLGADGTLWGGEALAGAPGHWSRRGSWRAFHPPGAERAARDPWRSAAALCWSAGRDFPRVNGVIAAAYAAWRRRLNCPETTSVGRLFDAAACLVLGVDETSFEAQGPMRLESMAAQAGPGIALSLPMRDDAQGVCRIDWAPLVAHLLDAARTPGQRAADFHATLAEAALGQALRIRRHTGFDAVGLCGGVFQNRVLCATIAARFAASGIEVHLAEKIPTNDAGLAFGQIVEYAAGGGQRGIAT